MHCQISLVSILMSTKRDLSCDYWTKTCNMKVLLVFIPMITLFEAVYDVKNNLFDWSHCVNVPLYWSESESDIASRLVHKESNLMFTLSSDKNQMKICFRSVSKNLWLK